MSKKRHRVVRKKGLPPGTLVYTGHRPAKPSNVNTIWYSDSEIEESHVFQPTFLKKPSGMTWMDVRGLSDHELIEKIGNELQVHPLALEDALDTQQRPKFEEYGEDLFFILTNLKIDKDNIEITTEQIAIYCGKNYVVSFQEDADDTLVNICQRIRDVRGRIRKKGPDYLTYSIIDTVVDNYYLILDELQTMTDNVEEKLHSYGATPTTKSQIFHLKKLLNQFRRHVLPLRDASMRFYRCESRWVDDSNRVFFRDVGDHVAQILDSIDNAREAMANFQELYQAEVGNRMNNVMRLLTVISTIFMPLSFIAGVYGMNFDYMPGLHNRYGFTFLAMFMLALMVGMLVYFRRKRWI